MPPNPLVGRERELEALRGLLSRRDVRLLVLTGAGGSGKTRLALEAAREAAPSFANGATLVELASVRDPELVLPTIARTLEIADSSGRTALETVSSALRERELLLVLDNAEHVRAATPALVDLLARAPRLRLLVTSRTVLHVSGEHVFPVAPLEESAALELFEQRARSLQPAFRLSANDRADVGEICARVDRLPLAIELAAARVRILTPAALLDRLEQRLSFLTGGPHDLPARQQTLRETLDWSYDLLAPDERSFLAGLSIFVGGFTIAAAAAVCLAGDEDRALDLVEALADASLVAAEEHGGRMRYRLLETVREYAADRLDELGPDETAQRHAEWAIALAEAAAPELSGEQQANWFTTLEAEHDNFRGALAFLTASGDRELRLRLTVALSRFWYVRGYLAEGRRRLEDALAETEDQPPMLLRRALTAAAALALLQGDYGAATSFSERALVEARRGGEPDFVANALSNLGAIVLAAGDYERAAVVLDEAVTLARGVGDERIAALAINNLGDLALTTGDYERAGPLFEESRALLQARGDTANIARSLFNSGAVDLMLDRREEGSFPLSGKPRAGAGDGRQGGHRLVSGRARLGCRGGGGRRARVGSARSGRRSARADGRRLQAVRAQAARVDDGTGASALRRSGVRRRARAGCGDAVAGGASTRVRRRCAPAIAGPGQTDHVTALVNANLGLRFLLELGALAAVGYWGWTTGDGVLGALLAVAAVAAVIVVWALFISPKARYELAAPARFAIELGVWLAAGAALWIAGHGALALAFVVVAIASGALNAVTRSRSTYT